MKITVTVTRITKSLVALRFVHVTLKKFRLQVQLISVTRPKGTIDRNCESLKGGERMTFKNWILQFTNEDSPRGDLAIDIRDDTPFPNCKVYRKISDYLNRVGASNLYMQSLEATFKQYKQEMSK